MASEITNVFVSYSRADALLVSPVVKLLRVNKSLVFQDIDAIQPGKRWQGEIARALAESNLVVVFWCTHARGSNEVSKEWHAAIEQKKDLLPLLLDTTPLPPELSEFQWIDFRGTVGANHTSIGSTDISVGAARGDAVVSGARVVPSAPVKSARWSARRLLLTACAAVFAIAAFLGWLFSGHTGPSSGAPPHITLGPTPSLALTAVPMPPSKAYPRGAPPYIILRPTPFPASPAMPMPRVPLPPKPGLLGFRSLLLLGIVFAVTVCLIWLSARRRKREIRIESSKPLPGVIERHIASELEAEIVRRTTLRRREGG
jgi:TIR domain